MADDASKLKKARVTAYYRQLMPFEAVTSWLTQGNTHSLENYEIALFQGLEMAPMMRKGHFSTTEEFRDTVVKRNADRIEIGPQTLFANEAFKRSLVVFDLDDADYKFFAHYQTRRDHTEAKNVDAMDIDDVATNISATEMVHDDVPLAQIMWKALVLSTRLLDVYLREVVFVHGVTPYRSLAVFSGRRGFHLWMPNRYRDAANEASIAGLVERLDGMQTLNGALECLEALESSPLINSSEERSVLREVLFDELAHFAVETLCDPAFWSPSNMGARQLAQDLAKVTNKSLDASANCFSALLDEEEEKLSLFGAAMQETTWKGDEVSPPRNGLPVDLNVNHRRMFWVLAGIMLVAPRVDHNVILGRGHLIKCPFSLHSATHLVSVPVDIHNSAQPLMENPEACIFKLGDFFSGNDAISRDTRIRFAQTIALFEERVAHEVVAQASS